MHTMDKTPRILTIIGLIFEGLGVVGAYVGGWLLVNIESLPGVSASSMDLSQADFQELMDLFVWFGNVMYGLAVFVTIIFLINVYLFTKLMGSKYTEEKAKLVYLYQAIWGGFNILFNQVTGILYLISGVSGYTGHKEEKNIREGI